MTSRDETPYPQTLQYEENPGYSFSVIKPPYYNASHPTGLSLTLTPYLTILTPQAVEDQTQSIHSQRALTAAPLLLRGGLFMALGLQAGGLRSDTHFYYKLSADLSRDLDKAADSLMALQTQITSLAAVALQNQRALDLLTAEKGGTCQFLREDCCFFR